MTRHMTVTDLMAHDITRRDAWRDRNSDLAAKCTRGKAAPRKWPGA